MKLALEVMAQVVAAGLAIAHCESARRARAKMWTMLNRLDRQLLRMQIAAGVKSTDYESANE